MCFRHYCSGMYDDAMMICLEGRGIDIWIKLRATKHRKAYIPNPHLYSAIQQPRGATRGA
jgi:hypothetical protein